MFRPAGLRWFVSAVAAVAVLAFVPDVFREPIEVVFVFSPDAEGVLEGPIATFNDEHAGDIVIVPEVQSSGSTESAIVDGTARPTMWMPAASTWGRLLDEHLDQRYVPAANPSFFWSPEVFGIWKDVREAIGEEVGWADLEALARDDAVLGDEGPFRLGHTKPVTSTSGLYAMVSAYTEAGATDAAGVARPVAREKVQALERSVRHYGDIAEDFCEPLQRHTTGFVSAVYMQETTLLKCRQEAGAPLEETFEEVFPENGTYAADYPCIILDAPWVTDEEQAAAITFRDWLGEAITDDAIVGESFRVGTPRDTGRIPDGAQELTGVIGVPDAELLDRVQRDWATETRKPAHVLLLLEWSHQMTNDGLYHGAAEMLDALVSKIEGSARVGASLVRFGDRIEQVVWPGDVATVAPDLHRALDPSDGPDATEDAVLIDAVEHSVSRRWMKDRGAIDLIVLVSTGLDDGSASDLVTLESELGKRRDAPSPPQIVAVRVGDSEEGLETLAAIAGMTSGRALTLVTAGGSDPDAERYTVDDAVSEIASLI